MIHVFIYIIIGIILAFYFWNKEYVNDYREAKRTGEIEHGMVCIYLVVVTIFWPLKIIWNLYHYLKKE